MNLTECDIDARALSEGAASTGAIVRSEWLVAQSGTEDALQPGQLGPGRDPMHLVRVGGATPNALCGSSAPYGWGRDLFARRGCSACRSAARRLGFSVPALASQA